MVFYNKSKKNEFKKLELILNKFNMSNYTNQFEQIKEESMINLENGKNIQQDVEQLMLYADFYHSLLIDENEELDYTDVLAEGYLQISEKNKLSDLFKRIFRGKSKEVLQNCLKEYSFDFLSGKREGENILKPVQRIINLIMIRLEVIMNYLKIKNKN